VKEFREWTGAGETMLNQLNGKVERKMFHQTIRPKRYSILLNNTKWQDKENLTWSDSIRGGIRI